MTTKNQFFQHLVKNLQSTFVSNFGIERTGKTVVVTVLDNVGATSANVTIGTVTELSDGSYGVPITFLSNFNGYVKFNNTTDGIINYHSFTIIDSGILLGKKVIICRVSDNPYMQIKPLSEQ